MRGLELWKVFFLFCFFLGGEEGLGGRALEKRLRVGWRRGRFPQRGGER